MRARSFRFAFLFTLVLLPVLAVSGAAQADPPSRTVVITPISGPQSWTGDIATGTNVNYNFSSGEPCHDTDGVPPFDPEYCDLTLLQVDVPADFWVAQTGGVEVRLDNYSPDPASDFDLQIFASDAEGTKGKLVGSSGGPPSAHERATFKEPSGYYLIQVVYFAVASSSYDATVEFFFRDRTPPDVDTPPGLQEYLASDPSQEWTSRSEPHIAQSPLDPDVLVAGSKFYNKDPDALGEYEFKIGSYVSFDGGVSWADLGQLKTCPASEAPPSSWPNSTCYPADDPDADGTGLEDASGGAGATVNEAPGGAQVTAGEHISGTEFSDSTPLTQGSVGPAPVFFADDASGCIWTTAATSEIDEWIGLAERAGSCPTFQNKFNAATAAGADGLIVINSDDTSPPLEGTAVAEIPGILVRQSDGNRLRDSLVPGDPEAVKVTLQIPRGPDFAEEYITSDIWMQFDDEGNAYAMVLDAPPFTSGVGWGMTLHRWESVSAEDVASGDTWGNRIPINSYPEDFPRDFLGFLDDKNTFAVNNAGPDGDSITGTMIACWGQNVSGVIKQQIVCERSTDAGQTWPDEPVPVSGVHQLVIGVHVIADEFDPNVFYAVWLQYESTVAGAPATLEAAKTVNGGVSWLPAVTVGTIDDIPRTFPRQGFRNLSIPIMAVGLDPDGAGLAAPPLYVVVADYLDAPDPANDEDDEQADIILFKSTDGGIVWTRASNITEYDGAAGVNANADQFQPYIDVTESGQLNVIYFDRRHDLKTATHPGNYFTDVYLSRSNNGGASWTDTRLTHDATDPEFNAPVSGSGLFFGDYQGLVADECNAIPFVNDTHLANDQFLDLGPVRDPEFDDGLPSSPYQESIAWRVPNTTEFGGSLEAPCEADLVVSNLIAGKTSKVRETVKTAVTATITNQGGGDVTIGTTTEFVLDGSTLLGDVETPPIPAGESVQVSTSFDPRTVQGEHELRATADDDEEVREANELNNSAVRTIFVQGNKVKNGSFSTANESGTGPANWSGSSTGAGTASESDGGTDGSKAVSITGTGGSVVLAGAPAWTSDPIAVTAGETLDLVVSVNAEGTSSPAGAGLVYLGAAGQVLDTVKLITAPLATSGFATLEERVTIPAGVADVKVVLTGFAPTDTSTAGTVTFDDVGLYAP
jgi:hypothetical protein